ncbi:MAG TPA: ABC transporter permease [Gaiellales bacterium]|jgi:putative spermidine/putrescine transport system permease protein|nr:ABC transporter permease [Gaiellales bacterium]
MPKAESPLTRLSAFFFRHRWLKLMLLLAVPLAWLVGVYLASLGSLLIQSFWRADELSPNPVHVWNLDNYRAFLTGDSVYRSIVGRTLGFAAITTIVDIALAFPLAYYLTRVASPRTRRLMLVLITVPLFSSLIVRLYSVRLILDDGGILHALLAKVGLNVQIGFTELAMAIAFAYVWLPFMILPVYAALERVPGSLIEASRDLGAKGSTTFRTVVLPLAFPGVVAGSIFTFSLTLGDFITPAIVGGDNHQLIGSVVYSNFGIANNAPFAAAFATVPLAIMAIYLIGARRLGAFDHL